MPGYADYASEPMRLPTTFTERRTALAGAAAGLPDVDVRRVGTARGPALVLHFSPGTVAWALVNGAVDPLLIDAGVLAIAGQDVAAALEGLVGSHALPRSAARIAVKGSIELIDAAAAA